MENVKFALPTIGSADMSRDDQGALLVNQATSIIVSRWLSHAEWAHEQCRQQGSVPWNNMGVYRISRGELIELINEVQNALSSF